jgi:plastocyanin
VDIEQKKKGPNRSQEDTDELANDTYHWRPAPRGGDRGGLRRQRDGRQLQQPDIADPDKLGTTSGAHRCGGSNSYSPNPVTVRVGQTVSWRNGDAVAHTATADGGAFDTGSIAPGASSSPLAANTAGTFPYHCAIHGFVMTGTLIVQ